MYITYTLYQHMCTTPICVYIHMIISYTDVIEWTAVKYVCWFAVCLTTPSAALTAHHRTVWLVDGRKLSLPVRYYPGICLEGLRKTVQLNHYSRLRDEIWTRDLPTTKHKYRFFRLELERMEEKTVVLVVTERLGRPTYLNDWVKAADNKWDSARFKL
jgi:hypothetical protein